MKNTLQTLDRAPVHCIDFLNKSRHVNSHKDTFSTFTVLIDLVTLNLPGFKKKDPQGHWLRYLWYQIIALLWALAFLWSNGKFLAVGPNCAKCNIQILEISKARLCLEQRWVLRGDIKTFPMGMQPLAVDLDGLVRTLEWWTYSTPAHYNNDYFA